MKKLFLIPVLLIAIFASCKKDSSSTSNTCTLDTTTILGNYQVTGAVYSYLIYSNVDLFNTTDPTLAPLIATDYPTCKRDDIISLKGMGQFVYTDTGTASVCSPNGNQTGSWSLNKDTLSIPLPSGNTLVTKTGVVGNFSCTTGMTVTVKNAFVSGDVTVITLTRK